jgi:hypothetical protein
MGFTVAATVTLCLHQNASVFRITLWLICGPADHGMIRPDVAQFGESCDGNLVGLVRCTERKNRSWRRAFTPSRSMARRSAIGDSGVPARFSRERSVRVAQPVSRSLQRCRASFLALPHHETFRLGSRLLRRVLANRSRAPVAERPASSHATPRFRPAAPISRSSQQRRA